MKGWLAPFWRRPRGGLDAGALHARFVAIDLETTGLDARRDAIVAASAVPFVEGAPTEGLVTLVNPARPIPPSATAIHGITDIMVAGAPSVDEALSGLAQVCGDDVIVGHGVAFDLAVLGRERKARGLPALRNVSLDTMRLAAALNGDWSDVSLDTVAARLGVTVVGRHTARGDAVAAGEILLRLLPGLTARGLRTVAELVWFQDSVPLHL